MHKSLVEGQKGLTTRNLEQCILYVKVNTKVGICSPDVPEGSSDFTSITPRYWNSAFGSIAMDYNVKIK